MTFETDEGGAREELRREIGSLPGVSSVDLSGYPHRVVIESDFDGVQRLAADAVRRLLARNPEREPSLGIEVVATTPARKRVRFLSIDVAQVGPGNLRARATLEWQGMRYEGETEEERTSAGEMRASAIAVIKAVQKVGEDRVHFFLIGVKEIHVFDHDLVAVLLHSPELPGYRMIGTSIIKEDRRTSAALAALSATNRAIGKFIEEG